MKGGRHGRVLGHQQQDPYDGRGTALCKCGAESPVLDSRRARERWQARHRGDVRVDRLVAAQAQRQGAGT